MTHIVIQYVIAHRLLGGLLVFAGDGGIDAIAVFISPLAVAIDHFLAHHFAQIRRGEGDFRRMIAGVDNVVTRLIVLGLGDIAFAQHSRQYDVAAGGGAVHRIQRVERRRRLRQPGDHRHFTQGQLIDRFAEIDLRSGADAIGAVAEVNLVQVQLKDFIFTQQLFDADREESLFDLAHQRLFRAEEEVTRQLLGNGAGALGGMAGEQRDAGRTEDADRVDAVMLIETAVFSGDKRLNQLRRHLLQRDRNTPFLAILRDEFAIRAIDLHRDLQTHILQRCDVGELWLYILIEAINRACSQQNATDCKDQ